MPRTRVKICGLTTLDDALAAVAAGADAIGLVLAERGPRQLSIAQAADIARVMPPPVCVVALVMDQPADFIGAAVAAVKPHLLQFHGAETNTDCARMGIPFIKAIPMGAAIDPLASMAAFPDACGFVLDAHAVGEAGGQARAFDWTRVPSVAAKPLWLAGGLDANNVADAIRLARPFAVDVSSGVEAAPGRKSDERMRGFVNAVRVVDLQLESSR